MQAILVLNAGSSTIKFSVFEFHSHPTNDIKKIYTGLIDKILTAPFLTIKNFQPQRTTILEKDLVHIFKNKPINDPYENSIREILVWLSQQGIEIIAAGHRVAHGGNRYSHAVKLNDEIINYLGTLEPLAPLHQPYNLKGCKIIQEIFPEIPQIVCFDTSFHTTCNKLSQLFAIPKNLTAQGIRRYGFHGLSYEYIVSQFDNYLPEDKRNGKIIMAHLGQGTSMCAVKHKTSVATTLSFSSLDGLPMGTRCGNIDPGVLLHLMTAYKMSVPQLETLLYKESGLFGVSGGISSDMRELLTSDHPDAKLAIDFFVYKVGAWIGMLTAELQGLDGLIFTAGIGENSPYVREKICENAAWLGVKIDAEKNQQNAATISTPQSKITVHVIHTDEELTIVKNIIKHIS